MTTTKALNYFLYFSAISLVVVACAKLCSAFGKAPILDTLDVLFPIRLRHLFVFAGIIEMVVATLLILRIQTRIKFIILLWLVFCFISYKLALIIIHAPDPCPCLGTATSLLHISPKTSTVITDVLILFYLIGSFICIALNCNKVANENKSKQ